MTTEREMFALLWAKHEKRGNGGAGEFALLAQVRNDAGFNATRTWDAVSVSLWPSRGHTIHVYEIKVSRSDWQRELAQPEKADDACRVADQFSIVAPAGIVRDGELPPTWGLIEERDGKLRTTLTAPFLRDTPDKTISRGLLVSMLRAAPGAIPGGKLPSASDRQIAEARAAGYADAAAAAQANIEGLREQRDSAAAAVHVLRRLGQAYGQSITQADVEHVAERLRNVDALADGRLRRVAQTLRSEADLIEGLIMEPTR